MRKLLVGICLVLSVVVPATASGSARTSYRVDAEQKVLKLLNTIRSQHGLQPLRFSSQLRSAAREHSGDMIQRNYFEHDSPREHFDVRIRRHVDASLVGENIAWGTGKYGTPEGIVSLWMHSAPHRRIILMGKLRRIGLGVAVGPFQGEQNASVATADFAS